MAAAPLYPTTHATPPPGLTPWFRPAAASYPLWRYVVDEARALIVRLSAYLSGLVVLAVIAADIFAGLPKPADAVNLRTAERWTSAARPIPAFDLPAADLIAKSSSYEISRHPEGGRKDSFRWMSEGGDRPLVELEIYRPGREIEAFAPPASALEKFTTVNDLNALQPAGLLDSKFGPVPLLASRRHLGRAGQCLGFVRTIGSPRLQISGWVCNGESFASQRALLSCALDRLTLLSAGNDPKLAELFAHAELRRSGCRAAAAGDGDWVTTATAPQLRGLAAN